MKNKTERKIRNAVTEIITEFANDFETRHLNEVDNPTGTINKKVNNVFMAVLGEKLLFYSPLVRSFDSSMGNRLEKMAIEIAKINYEVNQEVKGPLTEQQTSKIASLLENYKRRSKTPKIEDYKDLGESFDKIDEAKRHRSDYYLIDKETKNHYLIELKIGGDLDNKKARSEKEALLEQYAILANKLSADTNIHIRFGTAYNLFGEGKDWNQGRVLQFFAEEELLIGKEFWDFICKSSRGYDIVLDQYKKDAYKIKRVIKNIKESYL